jgi:mRNA interferase RelE/StbE
MSDPRSLGGDQPQLLVILLREPEKVLRKLSKDLLKRIRKVIDRLATDPTPEGSKKLVGYDNLYRMRVGDWRISYAVEQDRLIVLTVEITPRGGAYRTLPDK